MHPNRTHLLVKRISVVKRLFSFLRVLGLLILFIYIGTPILFAQTKVHITGMVYDEFGKPLPGAVVKVLGEKRGVVTDTKGKFDLLHLFEPQQRLRIQIRYIGLETVVIDWKGKPLHVKMKEDLRLLRGVTVKARPNINALDIRSRTGVVDEVDMKLVQQKPTVDFSVALQGTVPGMVIINRGELGVKPEIRIRGNTSFRKGDAANEPLYVLDGQVISSNAFLTLNPLDIKEIRVLKDAVASALYGVKAANGVLEITSKRGTLGPLKISANSNMGITFRGKRPVPMMKTAEKLEFERLTRSYNAPGYILSDDFFEREILTDIQRLYKDMYKMPVTDDVEVYKKFAKIKLEELRGIETDWFDELMHMNGYHSYNLSLRGGNDDLLYYVSGNFTRQGGSLPGNSVWRSTLRNSLDWSLREMGYITLSANLGYSQTDSPNSSNYSPQYMVETLNPYETKEGDMLYSFPGRRYKEFVNQYRSRGNSARVGTTLGLNLEPLEGLRVDGVLGVDYVLNTRENITPYNSDSEQRLGKRPAALGMISASKDNEMNVTSNFRLTYNKVFKEKHDFTVSANSDYYYMWGNMLSVSGHGIGQFESIAGVNKTLTGSFKPDFTGSNIRIAQLGFGFATGYTYDGKTDLFASYKADASNLLPKGKRWNRAWATGASLHIIPLFGKEKIGLLSDISFKSSYGHTASLGGVSASLTIPIFRYDQTSYYGDYFRHLGLAEMYNLDLRAEQVHSFDIGCSFGLYDNAHQLNVQLYRRRTVDALLMVAIPSSNGFKMMMRNVGILKNEGIELSLSNRWIDWDSFVFTTRATFAYNQNLVLDLYDGPEVYSDPDAVIPDYEVGKPYDLVHGFDALGVHPLTGKAMFKGRDGKEQEINLNPKRSDLVVLGHGTPPMQGTFGFSFAYKNLQLEAQFYYVLGGIKAYKSNIVRDRATAHKNAIGGQLAKTWFKEGDEAKLYPSPYHGIEVIMLYNNSRMVAVSDYLRFSMLSLNYRLPEPFMKNTLKGVIEFLSIGIQASNLFTISPYKGSNPEAGIFDTGIQPVLTANLNMTF